MNEGLIYHSTERWWRWSFHKRWWKPCFSIHPKPFIQWLQGVCRAVCGKYRKTSYYVLVILTTCIYLIATTGQTQLSWSIFVYFRIQLLQTHLTSLTSTDISADLLSLSLPAISWRAWLEEVASTPLYMVKPKNKRLEWPNYVLDNISQPWCLQFNKNIC